MIRKGPPSVSRKCIPVFRNCVLVSQKCTPVSQKCIPISWKCIKDEHFIEFLIPSHHTNYKKNKNIWSLIQKQGYNFGKLGHIFGKPGYNFRKLDTYFPGTRSPDDWYPPDTISGNRDTFSEEARWPFSWIFGNFLVEIPHSADMVSLKICPRFNIHSKIFKTYLTVPLTCLLRTEHRCTAWDLTVSDTGTGAVQQVQNCVCSSLCIDVGVVLVCVWCVIV